MQASEKFGPSPSPDCSSNAGSPRGFPHCKDDNLIVTTRILDFFEKILKFPPEPADSTKECPIGFPDPAQTELDLDDVCGRERSIDVVRP
jgi:hypothetical protein